MSAGGNGTESPHDQGDPLARIANALERIASPPSPWADWHAHPAYVWDGSSVRGLDTIEAPDLESLVAIDAQKDALRVNIARHAAGHAAHDMLLWGARGMGKSALVRAAIRAVQEDAPEAPGLVQVAADALETLPDLFHQLAGERRQYVIFIDDLGFAEDDTGGPRRLRSWLEGGVEARPGNTRLAVTSNRRAILSRRASEQDPDSRDAPLNARDATDDKLALADRFGLTLGFHPCSQADYLAIVQAYAQRHRLAYSSEEALAWALARGQRSGRAAWQFVVELAGREGRPLA